jgi:hypothetical protein
VKYFSILAKVLFSQEEIRNLADFAGVNLIMVIEKSNKYRKMTDTVKMPVIFRVL